MPLVRLRFQPLGPARDTLIRGTVTLDGGKPEFELIGFLTFDSAAQVQAALAKFGGEIIGDIPNFTNGYRAQNGELTATPLMQMNDLIS